MPRRVSFRSAGIACASALMFCLITGSGQAAAVSCGDVVTADVLVENDLAGCPENGLVIAASDVAVDLNGHTVSGTGAGTGILVAAPEGEAIGNVEITNGAVRGFDTGVGFEGDRRGAIRGVRVHALTISRNASGISAFTFANELELRDNRVTANSGHGIQTGDDTCAASTSSATAWRATAGKGSGSERIPCGSSATTSSRTTPEQGSPSPTASRRSPATG